MISDTLISPRADYSIRKRLEAYKRRMTSPNFKDILRQRCRERVKSRRGALFDQLRCLESEESVKSTLSQYIESDLQEMQSNCKIVVMESSREVDDHMEVCNTLPLSQLAATEKDRWILEVYERLIEAADDQLVALAEKVVCPCCEHGVLRCDDNLTVTCSLCSLLLPLRLPLPNLEQLIFQAVDCHELACSERPTFIVCPDDLGNNLLLLCTACGYAQQVV